jgi:hypothetical protein
MKTVAAPIIVLLLAGAAHAQTAPSQSPPGSDLTRDLNAGPPQQAGYLAPPPPPVPVEAAAPAPERAAAPTTPPPGTAPASAAMEPGVATSPTRVAPVAPPPAAPGSEAAPEAAAPPPAPAAPTVTVLDAAARAALPFAVDLPPGFEIVTGRPGPDFRIYTIRRGDRSFAMVYAGPASQFPIYSGQMVEAGGRASVVSTENGVRHAQEHLFQRATAPREIHVWTMSLDGAERALAEQIAQSLDVR